ncbi:MAG: hypothetical protein K2P12_00040 [Clostridia bacterium]|nr:hypothetical protein [Clostridia bacterium]
MNNCNCSGLLPLIFGYITGRNSEQNFCNCGCNCDQNVMPINNNNGFNNCWWIILLLLVCGCGNGFNNNCSCNG